MTIKDISRIEKVESPTKSIKSTPTSPALVRRTMGGEIKVIKARGAGAATRGFDFHEKV
jgi:hypothetical protein|tara:strand:+ start:954 stop:1130 length:177 start_codon:yes stop_codon:yes gene_type:complete